MEEYGSYNWNQQGNEPQNNTPMEPKKQPGKRNGNGARWAKKIGAVALSAVLFGGVAGGVFTGVTYATGATAKAQSTQTDSSKQETTKTTLQTTTSSREAVLPDRVWMFLLSPKMRCRRLLQLPINLYRKYRIISVCFREVVVHRNRK